MPAKKLKEYRSYFLHYAYCLSIIIFLTIAGFNLNKYITAQKVLGASVSYSPIQTEIEYWQKIIDKSPTYIDAYLELAKLNVQLGYIKGAYMYLDKARELDPNSLKIKEVTLTLGL